MAGSDDNSDKPDLAQIRKRINAIDQDIQSLINDRAKIAQLVGVAKGELASAVDYYRPEREADVLRRVLERNDGPLRNDEMLRLFREIMSACLAQQSYRHHAACRSPQVGQKPRVESLPLSALTVYSLTSPVNWKASAGRAWERKSNFFSVK